MAAPGEFLFSPFSWASFFVPLYLLIAGILLVIKSFSSRRFVVLMVSLVPFITLGLLLNIHFGREDALIELFLIQEFGERGSILLLLALLLAEFFLLLHIALSASSPRGGAEISTLGPGKPSRFSADQTPEEEAAAESSAGVSSEPSSQETPSLTDSFQQKLAPILAGGNFQPAGPSTPQNAEGESSSPLPGEPVFDEAALVPLSPPSEMEPKADVLAEGELTSQEEVDLRNDRPKPLESPEKEVVVSWESLVLADEGAAVDSSLGGTGEVLEDWGEEPSGELESMDFPEGLGEDSVGETELAEEKVFPEDDLEEDEFLQEYADKAPLPLSPELPPKEEDSKNKNAAYIVPVKDLLNEYTDSQYWIVDDETRRAAEILRLTLEEFKIAAEVTGISKGPVITMFELLPAPGVKLSKIVNLADNIALRLAASRVRIVAPIPGKHAVGIEVPNKDRAIVSFKEMLDDEGRDNRKMQVPVILGKDITGGARVIDLVQTPHLLIAGATGSGKSVCVNSLICSILYKRKPREVKLLLIDPKIVELKLYNDIPHLLTPVITEPKKAFRALQYAIFEMERRYSLLDTLGVRDIRSYNRRVGEQKLAADSLPYIVIVVDEFADLMATTGKELESTIARLTAMSRAVGIHLVLATQRPSVDVITGLIKANIPSRIAFMVASKMDSRIIIDGVGAEKLLGRGDMLFTSAWDPHPIRMQGAFLSEEEAERVANHVKSLGEPEYIDDEIFGGEDEDEDFQLIGDNGEDPLLEAAVGVIVEAGKASASYLQRRLKIGYNRAARLVEEMEHRGIVGPAQGSRPRDILHIPDYPESSHHIGNP